MFRLIVKIDEISFFYDKNWAVNKKLSMYMCVRMSICIYVCMYVEVYRKKIRNVCMVCIHAEVYRKKVKHLS